MDIRIGISSDHGGYALKEKVKEYLVSNGYTVSDEGPPSAQSCDYPDYAFIVARGVRDKKYERGIVICTSGIGVSICANKVKGVRAALCLYKEQAILSRQHNDANVLALSQKYIKEEEAIEIVNAWLSTGFEGGRHARRVNKIIENEVTE